MNFQSLLSSVPPGQLLTRLVHPSVLALLELPKRLPAPLTTCGEDVTTSVFEGRRGRIVVTSDGIRILIEAWSKEEKVLMCALRDRQLDGTATSSPLTFYPNTDPACNRLPGPNFHACELSIYSMDPSTFLGGLDVEGTLGHFIADPDYYVWKNFSPGVFFPLWEQAFHIGRGPWQTARPMKGVPQHFVENAINLLRELGYHWVDAVPSWFNVARFFEGWGFGFTYGEHELMYKGLLEGLRGFSSESEKRSLTRPQESWLVTLQNIPESWIPDELRLPARWPVTHTNSYWVRMNLELNPYVSTSTNLTKGGDHGGKLIKGISALRNHSCDDRIQITASSRRQCPCQNSLGASSPGATSPSATSNKS